MRISLLFLFLFTFSANADRLIVQPYLNSATPTSIEILWEQEGAGSTQLLFGQANHYSVERTLGVAQEKHPRATTRSYVYRVRLKELKPGSTYYYRLENKDFSTPMLSFKTVPLSPNSFKFVVYSDTQRNPGIHRKISISAQKTSDPAFVLVPGDLVHVGAEYDEYKNKFFGPAESLFSKVPVYPAVGNHEYQGLSQGETPIYMNYFSLPENGSKDYPEHWYSFSYGNTKIISLNTNFGAKAKFKWHPDMYDEKAAQEQLSFLKKELEVFCQTKGLDFVFSFFHHPNVAELWSVGGEEYSQKVVDLMEKAVNQCGKAGGVFNGHMHGYAKGQSKDAPLYWVTAASAGGLLDYWGEYENFDFPNIQKSIPSFGYVEVTVQKHPARFYMKRYTIGNELEKTHEPTVEDTFEYRSDNLLPHSPRLTINTQGVLSSSDYSDPDGDTHLETEWELFDIKGNLIDNVWRRFENIYNHKKTVLSNELRHLSPKDASSEAVTARVRYRDNALFWSEWSNVSTTNENQARAQSNKGPKGK